jgi:predicted RND superfamily exporter protein
MSDNQNTSPPQEVPADTAKVYRMGDEENFLEKILFNNRVIWLILFGGLTIFFLQQAVTKFRIDSGVTKMLPMQHQYLKNMFNHITDLSTKGLSFQIVIEVKDKNTDIFNKDYLQVVQEAHDKVFYINGVDRTSMRSFWAPSVIWMAVTPEGFKGGPLMPGDYDGGPASLAQLRQNVLRSNGEVGRLFANNFKSSMVEAYLFNTYPEDEWRKPDGSNCKVVNNKPEDASCKLTNKRGDSIDYQDLGHQLEAIRSGIKAKYGDKYNVYIMGDPKMIGDLIDGFGGIVWFFAITLAITFILLYLYARCIRVTLVPLVCSLIAVVWQIGILLTLAQHGVEYGHTMIDGKIIDRIDGLGVFSMLVPFLMVAIGVSHSVQFVNVMVIEAANGHDKMMSARRAFRQNYLPGLIALLTNIIGFGTMALIPIGAIQELAITASLGVTVIIITKIILLPIMMSYIGISPSGIKHMQQSFGKDTPHWTFFSRFAETKWAVISLIVAVIACAFGVYEGRNVKIGDVTQGSSELLPNSIYNKDVRYVISNYSTSSDIFVVMVETKKGECTKYSNIEAMDRLEWRLKNTEGVQAAISPAYITRIMNATYAEGHVKWQSLMRNQKTIDSSAGQISEQGMINAACSFAIIPAFLTDHKAETLDRVVKTVEDFAKENNSADITFLNATGGAGIAAAVNQEIKSANHLMLLLVYGVIALLLLITFRSVRVMLCIIAPLYMTSVLCEALMANLHIGIKVATLPVIALGVGVGVDYAIYLYNRMESFFRQGMSLEEAYLNTLKTTGRAVLFTGLTLAVGVATWYFSAVQFQKDMGTLLVFMFLWNMLGALWLLPVFVRFLINPAKMYPVGSKGSSWSH